MGDWRQHAACIGADPELFFSSSRQGPAPIAAAKRVCAACPVARECLTEAMTMPAGGIYGVWGGKGPRELRAMKRRRDRREARTG